MVNVAEEVKDPRRTMPAAILLALAAATTLYVLVALVAVLTVPPDSLATSDAPLVAVLGDVGASSRHIITVISIMAIASTGLAQIIMTSRIIYGMARQGTAPGIFDHVHSATRTPFRSTLFVAAIILLLALNLQLVTLAQTTSFIILGVFILVNGSLIRIKLTRPAQIGAVTYPLWIPVTGGALCCVLLAASLAPLL